MKLDEQSMNHLSKNSRCLHKVTHGAGSGLIDCAGMTRRWGLLSHARKPFMQVGSAGAMLVFEIHAQGSHVL